MTAAMINTGSSDTFFPLSSNTVELLEPQINWAVQAVQMSSEHESREDDLLKNKHSDNEQRWQNFLQALAIAGFKQWLEAGAVSPACCYLYNEKKQFTPPSINFQVGDYRLCIVAMSSVWAESVEVGVAAAPKTTSETSPSAAHCEDALAHFYVLVEVQEEVNQVCILGAIGREQLLKKLGWQTIDHRQSLQIPLTYFDVLPEQLLLYISCLVPVPLSQSAASLADPTAIPEVTVVAPLKTVLINTGYWLQNQIDAIAEELSWALLPPISSEMRPVRTGVETVLEVLAEQGVQLPMQAKGAGGPISVGMHTFQVYVWVWLIETENVPEWTLFFLLGPQIGESLPTGLQLQISDDAVVLTEGTLNQSVPEAYLYAQVQGELQEVFNVCIILPNGTKMMLPAFSFEGQTGG